jgi:hypothetical protein
VFDLTLILKAIRLGESKALEDQLRKLANGPMSKQPAEHTLHATTLVHEAYMRLVRNEDVDWKDSRHFFATGAVAMK